MSATRPNPLLNDRWAAVIAGTLAGVPKFAGNTVAVAAAGTDYSVPAAAETIAGVKTHTAPIKVSGATAFVNGILHKILAGDGLNPDFNFLVSSNAINGGDPRNDLVFQMGWNPAPGSVENAAQGAISWNIESYYIQGGPQWEYHDPQVILVNGTVIRSDTTSIKQDGSSVAKLLQTTHLEFNTPNGTQQGVWNMGGAFQILGTNSLQFGTNNAHQLTQVDAAGTTPIPLVGVNGSNQIVTGQVGNDTLVAANLIVTGLVSTPASGPLRAAAYGGTSSGNALVTEGAISLTGTLFVGGSEPLYKNGAGTVNADFNLRLAGSAVVNQNQTAPAGQPIQRIRPSSGQTAPLLQCEDGGGTNIAGFSSAGGLLVGGGALVKKIVSATATLDFPSIAAGLTSSLTMTVTGAVAGAGSSVELGPPAALNAGLVASAVVSATDTVTVTVFNGNAGAIDPASALWRATVKTF